MHVRRSFSCLSLVLLAACSSVPTITTESKPGQDFSAYKRFALLPLPDVKVESDPGLMQRIGEPARKTVVEVLTGKGFVEVDRAQADFTVNVRGQSIPHKDTAELGYAPWFDYSTFVDNDAYSYDERTLAVEICDQKQQQQVWVGWLKREAYGRVEADKVCEGLRRILALFPPGAAKH